MSIDWPDTDVRDWWLDYARQVVDLDDRHRPACVRRGGSAGPPYKADVRWPGYLGPAYRPGGMLVVANIHREFDSGRLKGDAAFAEGAADVVRDWKAGRIDGDQYLRRNTEVYQRGLAAWIVGGTIGKAMGHLRIPLAAIAYTNGAKCQAVDAGFGLQQICQPRWPLQGMAAALRPGIVIIAGTALGIAGSTGWPPGTVVIGVNQRGGMVMPDSPWQPPDGDRRWTAWSRHLSAIWAGSAKMPR